MPWQRVPPKLMLGSLLAICHVSTGFVLKLKDAVHGSSLLQNTRGFQADGPKRHRSSRGDALCILSLEAVAKQHPQKNDQAKPVVVHEGTETEFRDAVGDQHLLIDEQAPGNYQR